MDNSPYDSQQNPAESAPKQGWTPWGCVGVGCLVVLGTSIVLTLCAGFGGYFFVVNQVQKYTSDQPVELPPPSLSEEEIAAVKERVDNYSENLKDGGKAEDLILTEDELNGLIAADEDMKGRVHVDIEDGELTGEVSVPADWFWGGEGRYFNGKVTVEAYIEKGRLYVYIQDAEINGESLPKEFVEGLSRENVAKEFNNKKESREMIAQFESLEIQDDKIILRAKKEADIVEEEESDELLEALE